MNKRIIDTLLLLALPASGKSEIRRFLASFSDDEARERFCLGPTVQLDDYPYVHLMRRIDDELAARGAARIFFEAPDRSLLDGRDWGTLIELLNDDYAALTVVPEAVRGRSAAALFERIDAASVRVGISARLARLDQALRASVADAIEPEAYALVEERVARCTDSLRGKTVVIEFARGGPEGAALPLDAPLGYRYSVSRLAPSILERASLLYVWVSPEESRRKNEARADPNDPGSILHHGVPEYVMRNDYGVDDMTWWVENSRRPGFVDVKAADATYALPAARFDNRSDKTSFVRQEPAAWSEDSVEALRLGLSRALHELAESAH